ncbi:hypothetical protein [Selenomonas ruminantium]|uniref:hypothetical protein n=1 Tax=Selenomonas ruminantium TaxID=971 RepID=UPI0026EB9EBE|nr:hypothetical protein [Selenomonas ruminantium]
MSKMSKFREVLIESDNLSLFEEEEMGFKGHISIPKLQKSFFTLISLPEDNFYNTITIALADVEMSKINEAYRLLNRLNANKRSGTYYIIPGNNYGDDAIIIYRDTYTALTNDFDGKLLSLLLLRLLEEIEKGEEYKEIMRLIWA